MNYVNKTEEWTDKYNMKEQIFNTIDFMNTNKGTEEEFLKFYKVNDLLDESRSQNFQKTFPELYSILKPKAKV